MTSKGRQSPYLWQELWCFGAVGAAAGQVSKPVPFVPVRGLNQPPFIDSGGGKRIMRIV